MGQPETTEASERYGDRLNAKGEVVQEITAVIDQYRSAYEAEANNLLRQVDSIIDDASKNQPAEATKLSKQKEELAQNIADIWIELDDSMTINAVELEKALQEMEEAIAEVEDWIENNDNSISLERYAERMRNHWTEQITTAGSVHLESWRGPEEKIHYAIDLPDDWQLNGIEATKKDISASRVRYVLTDLANVSAVTIQTGPPKNSVYGVEKKTEGNPPVEMLALVQTAPGSVEPVPAAPKVPAKYKDLPTMTLTPEQSKALNLDGLPAAGEQITPEKAAEISDYFDRVANEVQARAPQKQQQVISQALEPVVDTQLLRAIHTKELPVAGEPTIRVDIITENIDGEEMTAVTPIVSVTIRGQQFDVPLYVQTDINEQGELIVSEESVNQAINQAVERIAAIAATLEEAEGQPLTTLLPPKERAALQVLTVNEELIDLLTTITTQKVFPAKDSLRAEEIITQSLQKNNGLTEVAVNAWLHQFGLIYNNEKLQVNVPTAPTVVVAEDLGDNKTELEKLKENEQVTSVLTAIGRPDANWQQQLNGQREGLNIMRTTFLALKESNNDASRIINALLNEQGWRLPTEDESATTDYLIVPFDYVADTDPLAEYKKMLAEQNKRTAATIEAERAAQEELAYLLRRIDASSQASLRTIADLQQDENKWINFTHWHVIRQNINYETTFRANLADLRQTIIAQWGKVKDPEGKLAMGKMFRDKLIATRKKLLRGYARSNEYMKNIDQGLGYAEEGVKYVEAAGGALAGYMGGPAGSIVYSLSFNATRVAIGERTPREAAIDVGVSAAFTLLGGPIGNLSKRAKYANKLANSAVMDDIYKAATPVIDLIAQGATKKQVAEQMVKFITAIVDDQIKDGLKKIFNEMLAEEKTA